MLVIFRLNEHIISFLILHEVKYTLLVYIMLRPPLVGDNECICFRRTFCILKMAWSRRFIPKLFVWHSSSDIVRMKWRYYRAGLYTEKKRSHWLKQWSIRKGLVDKKRRSCHWLKAGRKSEQCLLSALLRWTLFAQWALRPLRLPWSKASTVAFCLVSGDLRPSFAETL